MKKIITVLWISFLSTGLWQCKEAILVSNILKIPDLSVATLSASHTNIMPSEQITLTATIYNLGEGSSGTSLLRWYRSTDSIITTTDTQVGAEVLSNLSAGETSIKTISITAPSTPGTYYYGVCVDNATREVQTANNCSSALELVVTIPDLMVNLSASRTNVVTSSTINLSALITNAGDGSSTTTTMRWYVSTDRALDTNTDTEIGTSTVSNLGTGASVRISNTITVPETPGTYYYFACVDSIAGEVQTANNCSSAVNVSVVFPPDLVVSISSSNTNVFPSEMITLTAMVSNTGASSSTNTTLRWYRSVDTNININEDIEIGTSDLNSLAAGDSSTVSISIMATNAPGTYYYYACVDNATTANKCSSKVRVVILAPNLIITNMTASSTNVYSSEIITLSATVRNTGNLPTTNTRLYLRWYLFTNNTFDINDYFKRRRLGLLAVGMSKTFSNMITVPNIVGTNYYRACVESVIDEYYTNDNCSSVKVVVRLPIHPHLPASDFNTLNGAGNRDPQGIWSDGTTIWVANTGTYIKKLFAYSMSNKSRDSGKDFNTLRAASNHNPSGIWSDGTNMWVADQEDDKIYAYWLSNKARNTNEDFDTLTNAYIDNPQGLWSDGTTMWVVDNYWDFIIGGYYTKLYAYSMSTKSRNTNEDFTLASDNNNARGIWSDGTTMWVSDIIDVKLYAYDMVTKAHVPNKDFPSLRFSSNNSPTGIWSDGSTMWVAANAGFFDYKLYAYDARRLVNTE